MFPFTKQFLDLFASVAVFQNVLGLIALYLVMNEMRTPNVVRNYSYIAVLYGNIINYCVDKQHQPHIV